MNRLILFVFFMILVITAGILIWSCRTEEEVESNNPNPILDIRALAEFDQDIQFQQVLLRMELLKSNKDILKHGLSTPEEHQARLSYYLFGFIKDVALISDGDTIQCHDLHMERTFLDLPYMNFILTFPHSINKDDQILIHEGVYTQQSLILNIEQNQLSR